MGAGGHNNIEVGDAARHMEVESQFSRNTGVEKLSYKFFLGTLLQYKSRTAEQILKLKVK